VQKPKVPTGQKSEEAILANSSSGPKGGKPSRFIPQQPDRILDAPDLKDDFYVNVLHWSVKNQVGPLHLYFFP
jgi:cell division cycle 20, cofactor of APC complex